MLKSGLVSITFRQLSPEKIIELVAQAGLEGIEWGGDIHVPHGDIAQAQRVQRMTADAGLAVAAYGSYYRVGHPEDGPFEAVLECATMLGAPVIRVWAGKMGSDVADQGYFDSVVDDSVDIANQAAQAGIAIAYEFHGNTLTDTNDGTCELLARVDHTNIGTYWQPPRDRSVQNNQIGIQMLRPWLHHIHVFSWQPGSGKRLPLVALETEWHSYLQTLDDGDDLLDTEHYALLEFVVGDEPQNFLSDAKMLKKWLK